MIAEGDPQGPAELEEEDTRPARAGGPAKSRLLRWLQMTRLDIRGSSGFENQRYLAKWLLVSGLIGIVAGLGAVLFTLGIQWATDFFLGTLVGYTPPSPIGEGEPVLMDVLKTRWWLLPFITALGGLLSGIIVFSLAPEAEGHGTDSAIDAIHHKWGRIRPLIPPVKLIASAITIGAGGSGGREGPAAQISAGFGSLLSNWLHLDTQDRRIAVAAGMGAGIGSIFRAPLGGAVMAAEILYIHDLEVEALIPGLMASIVGYSVYGAFFGFTPIFGALPSLALDNPFQLVYYAALGVLCGGVGILYARGFYGITALFHKLIIPRWVKPAMGGFLVGLMGIMVPGALHMGYGWVQLGMGQTVMLIPLWMLLILPFAKILSTSLSIGSGGSGGIFGPGMVIGGMLGAAFWRLGHDFLPMMPNNPGPFVIIGMMALFGAVAHAPLAVMLMVAEMTGNLSLLAPAMIAVAISTVLVGETTIYRSQLPNRAYSPAHRVRFSFPLLSSLLVRDAETPPGPTVTADMPVSAAESLLTPDGPPGVAVVNERQEVVGTIGRDEIRQVAPEARSTTPIRKALAPGLVALDPDLTLDVALEKFSERGISWAPVVEAGHVVGSLLARDIVHAYKDTLQRSVRRATALTAGTVLFEAQLSPTSPLVGTTLREAGLPANTLVVAVNREGSTLFPRATTRLQANDVVMVMADPASEQALRTFLEGRSCLLPPAGATTSAAS